MIDTGLRRLVNAVLVTGYAERHLPDWLATELSAGLGGVAWFAQNVTGGAAGRTAAHAEEVRSHHPSALVWCDEEGGTVTRLDHDTGSPFPGHAALGRLDEPDTTRRVAGVLGARAVRAGVDVVLAPVVDVNSDPANPVIGVRSFGADPDLVARHGAAFVEGLQDSGAAACAKHFPGHGATRTDSHLGLPVVDASEEVLRKRDLAPFAAAVSAGVQALMTAHVVYPAVDPAPATTSKTWLGLARSEIGFRGVIATDALDMHAISRGVGRGPGAVAALRAGADAVCIGNPVFPEPYAADRVLEEVRQAVLAAVAAGELSTTRLEEAAGRVADLAAWRRAQPVVPARRDELDTGRLAAARSLMVTSPDAGSVEGVRSDAGSVDGLSLDRPPLVLVAGPRNLAAGEAPLPADCTRHWPEAKVVPIGPRDADGVARALGSNPDLAAVLVVDGLVQRDLVDAVTGAYPRVVVVDAGPPRPGGDRAASATTIHTWGGGAGLVAAFDLLAGG